VVRTLGLDFVEVLDNLAAGLNNGGDDTGFPRLAGVVVGVAGAANSSGGQPRIHRSPAEFQRSTGSWQPASPSDPVSPRRGAYRIPHEERRRCATRNIIDSIPRGETFHPAAQLKE
jgi:hypothetical protein